MEKIFKKNWGSAVYEILKKNLKYDVENSYTQNCCKP